MWHWLIHTDAGLLTRIAIGVFVFGLLAIVDLRRRGREATRWREYSFLLACVAAALIYGIINDQITCSISPEYFLYGKGVAEVVGANADSWLFRWEVAKIGMKATWSAGLIIGVAMLVANNPSARRRQLSIVRLLKIVPVALIAAAIFGLLFGLFGLYGFLTPLSQDFTDMVRNDEMRPLRFIGVFGVHLGGYVGGLIGTVVAIVCIRLFRVPSTDPAVAIVSSEIDAAR